MQKECETEVFRLLTSQLKRELMYCYVIHSFIQPIASILFIHRILFIYLSIHLPVQVFGSLLLSSTHFNEGEEEKTDSYHNINTTHISYIF